MLQLSGDEVVRTRETLPHLQGRAVLRDLAFGGSLPMHAFSEREGAISSLQSNLLAGARKLIPQLPLDIQVKWRSTWIPSEKRCPFRYCKAHSI